MSLESAYSAFTAGKGDMDSRTFVKLCKETGLLDKKLTTTDCDLIFTKCKAKGAKRFTYPEFEEGIREVAKRKGVTFEEVATKISSSQGPTFTGTKMDNVRFYDDKSTWGSGVHAHGGPSTCDKPNTKFNSTFGTYEPNEKNGCASAITLDQICDRSTPDVRGVNRAFNQGG